MYDHRSEVVFWARRNAAMVAQSSHMNVYEFELRGEDEPRAELIDGEIVVAPEPTPEHQRIAGRWFKALQEEAERRNNGEWFLTLNLVFSPHNVFIPDLSFFRSEDIPEGERAFVAERPAIVVEILSPSSRGRDLITKRSKYADRGIEEYWVIDPRNQSIVIHVRDQRGLYVAVEMDPNEIPAGIFKGLLVDRAYMLGGKRR
jgi:Uma2 family endonuclease